PTTFALRVRCSTGLSYFGGWMRLVLLFVPEKSLTVVHHNTERAPTETAKAVFVDAFTFA
ncbi:hypothetical protein, partial [Pseudomonas sp.]|uniref:hypothetical protein n=1 Tax=Pseudomonas sp. TaxID=306 RepID=UPI003FD6C8C2